MKLEELESRVIPSPSYGPIQLSGLNNGPTTNGNVQLGDFSPVSGIPSGVSYQLTVTVTYNSDVTWSKTFTLSGGISAQNARDLVLSSLVSSGFTATASGRSSLVISGYTDSSGNTYGIDSLTFNCANPYATQLKNPNSFLPTVSGTTN